MADGDALAASVAAHGLGPVAHVHRLRSTPDETAVHWGLGATTVLVLAFCTQSRWLGVLLVLVIAAVVLTMAVYRTAPEGRQPFVPRRIAVCAGGLVVERERAAPVAVAWRDVIEHGPVPRGPGRIAYEVTCRDRDDGGKVLSFELAAHTQREALVRSLGAGAAAPVSPWPPRLAALAAVAAVVLFARWAVLPDYVTRSVEVAPSSSLELGEVCDAPGVAYRGAPPYAGPPPHPLTVVPGRWARPEDPTPWAEERYDTVQLVACLEPDGDDGSAGRSCTYSTSNMGIGGRVDTRSLIRTWYRLTVREVRTQDEVGSVRVLGEEDTCPRTTWGTEDVRTLPSDAQLHAALDPYTGRTG